VARDQPFSQVDWQRLLAPATVIGQRVDGYGKARIFGIRTPTGTTLTFHTLPSQPLNLPELPTITAVNFEVATAVFGPATSRTLTGVWFQLLDFPEGVYVPILGPIPEHLPLADTPAPIHVTTARSHPIELIQRFQRITSLFLQLLEWLWKLDGYSALASWWAQYVREDPTITAATIQVGPTITRRRMPLATTTSAGLVMLTTIWPGVFQPDGVHLPPGLYLKALGYFQRRAVELQGLRPTADDVTYLRGLYTYESDFPSKPGSLIFVNPQHLTSWLKYQGSRMTLSSVVTPIRTTLDLSMAFFTDPYPYYERTTERNYLVQNARGGDIKRAVTIVLYWNAHGINLGADAEPTDLAKVALPYVVYGIGKEETLIPIKNSTVSSRPRSYFEFLCYKPEIRNGQVVDGTFAALLPM
jgi:hypothetical protein